MKFFLQECFLKLQYFDYLTDITGMELLKMENGSENLCTQIWFFYQTECLKFFLKYLTHFKFPKINASIHKYFCSISGDKERDGWLQPVH